SFTGRLQSTTNSLKNGPANVTVKEVNDALLQKNIIGGYDLGRDYKEHENHMLVAVTELRTKEEIDTLVNEMGAIQ
ncbi:hypothetical protein ACT453_30040, partial [Bacillus sp. D-CC]